MGLQAAVFMAFLRLSILCSFVALCVYPGDAGGPLLANGILVGVASFGAVDCGTPGAPGVYVRITSFLEWIHSRGLDGRPRIGNAALDRGSNAAGLSSEENEKEGNVMKWKKRSTREMELPGAFVGAK